MTHQNTLLTQTQMCPKGFDDEQSNMYSIEALMNILEDKGLITKQEVLGELQKLKVEHQKDVN